MLSDSVAYGIAAYDNPRKGTKKAVERLTPVLADAGEGLAHSLRYPAYNIPHPPLKHEYRKRLIQKDLMFYWADGEENKCTIAHVIYAKRDYQHPLLEE